MAWWQMILGGTSLALFLAGDRGLNRGGVLGLIMIGIGFLVAGK
jgi:hypothetical protein